MEDHPVPRITTPFGFPATALEVVRGIDLSDRRALVTGAASGIGAETARALAAAGAEVVLAVRNLEAGRRVAADISAETGNDRVRVRYLDLLEPASIAALASGWRGPLHILVNNAGVMACPERRTAQGWELQLATNHLGHFALALAFHRALARAEGARIVSVSSSAHQLSPVLFDDLQLQVRAYDPWTAYGQSKTANVLFAVEATRRWAQDGILANAAMPGAILTHLQRHVGSVLSSPREYWKTPAQGAATPILLAASPLLAGVGARYFANCNEARILERRSDQPHLDLDAVDPYALDPDAAARLWEVSLDLLAGADAKR
jgi:NAD(P)-dependent dehydrogenase (short-subunit alcohol dehydrogenase family)